MSILLRFVVRSGEGPERLLKITVTSLLHIFYTSMCQKGCVCVHLERLWEVAGHFLEENDFRPFPEIIISVVNVFFPKSKSSLQNLHQNLQK